MPIEISTGGLKKFVYPQAGPKADPELESNIEQGYEEVAKRKRNEKIMKWVIAILAVILILMCVFLR